MALEIFKLLGTVAISKDQALKDIKAIQTQAEKTSTAMGGSFTKFSGYVEKHSAQIQKAGKMMTIFGGIAIAVFAVAVKGAADFETQLANVSTMLDESAMRILPEYRKGLQSLSVEFGESTQTLSKGLYDILSASIPPAEALGVLEISAKAAAAGITDTGVAADAITTILNSYGFSADQAGMVSDKLFAIVKEGKTTFAELAPSIGKVAATASMAGLSFDDLGACIATMTRAGIRTEETMTAINGVLIAFLKPTDEAIAAAGKFGLELNTTTLQTEGLTGVMEKLSDATAEQLAEIFPNIRGLKGMAAALGDAEGYARSYALMLESAGLTQEAFAKQSDTLNFKLDQLKSMFNIIRVTIGEALIPVVEDLTEKVMKALIKVKEWTEANKPLSESLVKWAAGISGVLLASGPLVMILPGFVKNLGIIAGWIGILSDGFAAWAVSLGLTAGGLGLVIAGITATVLYVSKEWAKALAEEKRIAEETDIAIKSQMDAYLKLQKAWDMTGDELREYMQTHELSEAVIERHNKKIEEERELLAEEKRALEETLASWEKRDAAVLEAIISGKELSEEQEQWFELRQRMSDVDRTATQQKIDDLDRECVALMAHMDTNLMTMGQIDQYRQVMLQNIIAESSERQEHLRNIEEIEKRVFDLTHTQTEIAIHDLDMKRDKLIEVAKSAMLSLEEEATTIEAIMIWYELERISLDETIRKKEEAKNKNAELEASYKTLIDRIFELTHTPMEIAIKKLDEQKQKYIELGHEIGEVNKWHDLEIAKLNESNIALDEHEDKLVGATEATVALGILGGESWEGFTTHINRATVALSNFTKEGVAAAIAQIKMKFFPILQDLYASLETAGSYVFLVQGQINEVLKMQAEQIAQAIYGLTAYEEALEMVGAPSKSTGGGVGYDLGGIIKGLQRGGGVDNVLIRATAGEYLISKPMTEFIRRTGVVPSQLGGAIASGQPTPAPGMQRGGLVGLGASPEIKYNIGPIYIEGDGDVEKIKRTIKQTLDESRRKILRSGYELRPGVV